MPRPPLDPSLSPDAFREAYWRKAERVAFCREQGLPSVGPKAEITERVAAFLTDGTVLAPIRRPRPAGAMPETFTRGTMIGEGWRCTQALRDFFEREAGPRFRFNAAVRAAIHDGAGSTLADVLAVWAASRGETAETIAPQFEYTRHMRAYFEAHPDATREDAIAAWNAGRGAR